MTTRTLLKDLRMEWRSKDAINSMLFFSLLVVVIFSFAFNPNAEESRRIAGGLIWVAFLFAAVVALNQTWARELRNQVLDAYRVSPAPPNALFLAKVLGNFLFVMVLEALMAPLFVVFYQLRSIGPVWQLVVVALLGTWALVVNGTFFAALSIRTRSREIMLPLILFPISIPALLAMVDATTMVLTGDGSPDFWLKMLLVYDVVFTLVCLLLFESVLKRGMKSLSIGFIIFTLALLGFSTYQALVVAPTEQTMGDVQRIFYYHVPSAWVAGVCFFVNFLASIVYLWQRSLNADALAAASAEVGVVFCTIVLITGPIWARPVWGIWWTWDARLTTTLVLWLIYVSYLVLRRFASGSQTQVLAAALGIFGFVDVPIVYMTIRWFRTQHPSPVMGGGENSGLAPEMLHAFLWNLLAFTFVGICLIVARYVLQKMENQVEAAHAQLALKGVAR